MTIFTAGPLPENLFAVQSFVGISAFTGLLLASATLENRQSELKFRSMFEITGVPMAQIDLTGRFTLVNDQFCLLTGYSREELLGMRFRDITYPEDIAPNDVALARLISGQDKYLHFEKRYVRKDGTVIWVVVDSTLLTHQETGKGTGIIAVLVDITKRKIAEQQAEESYKMAQDANRAKSAVLASMSHEIRTPLGVIVGFTELLKDPNLPANLREEFSDTAHRNAIELGQLIDDILDLSKVEAGRMDVSPESFNLKNLLSDIRDTFSSAVKAKGLSLNIFIDEKLPKEINTDPKRLRQILINIVGNSIKYTSAGTIAVKVAAVKEKSDSRASLGFYVEDTGCGIAEDEVPNLFQPFVRLERATKKNIRGTGLGLELSKRLAKLLGGDVKLTKSKVDVGSTFLITINPGIDLEEIGSSARPVVKAADTVDTIPVSQERLDGVNVLVAEDTPDQAMLIRLLLTNLGANVELAENGAIAVEKALANNFDVILMDMHGQFNHAWQS